MAVDPQILDMIVRIIVKMVMYTTNRDELEAVLRDMDDLARTL
jgi:hypothetical protein